MLPDCNAENWRSSAFQLLASRCDARSRKVNPPMPSSLRTSVPYRPLKASECASASCRVLREFTDRLVVGRVIPSENGPSGSVALMVSTFCARL